jgi:hypothetical protein
MQMIRFSTILIIFLACSLSSMGSDLSLNVEVNSVGSLLLYVTNDSDTDITMITSGLSKASSGTRHMSVQLEPLVLVKLNPERKLLKQSLAPYWPVTLKPGETTYIQHSIAGHGYKKEMEQIDIEYNVPQRWGKLHGVWSGKLTTGNLQVNNGKIETKEWDF